MLTLVKFLQVNVLEIVSTIATILGVLLPYVLSYRPKRLVYVAERTPSSLRPAIAGTPSLDTGSWEVLIANPTTHDISVEDYPAGIRVLTNSGHVVKRVEQLASSLEALRESERQIGERHGRGWSLKPIPFQSGDWLLLRISLSDDASRKVSEAISIDATVAGNEIRSVSDRIPYQLAAAFVAPSLVMISALLLVNWQAMPLSVALNLSTSAIALLPAWLGVSGVVVYFATRSTEHRVGNQSSPAPGVTIAIGWVLCSACLAVGWLVHDQGTSLSSVAFHNRLEHLALYLALATGNFLLAISGVRLVDAAVFRSIRERMRTKTP